MKIKITSCGRPSYWYADWVGKILEVERDTQRQYYYYEKEKGYIYEDDCVVVTDEVTPVGVEPDKCVAQENQVGDIHSSTKGSGARYNYGKPDYSMLAIEDFADSLIYYHDDQLKIVEIIRQLGKFQKSHDAMILRDLIDNIGLGGVEESTYVFTYGAKKYKAWNWLKGMQWSVPLACAVRHTLAILNGEEVDAESGRKHLGHVACNIFMLIHYSKYYSEGNDLPPKEYFQ